MELQIEEVEHFFTLLEEDCILLADAAKELKDYHRAIKYLEICYWPLKDQISLQDGNLSGSRLDRKHLLLDRFEEIYNFEHTPHPIEFDMYYSC